MYCFTICIYIVTLRRKTKIAFILYSLDVFEIKQILIPREIDIIQVAKTVQLLIPCY